MRSMDKSEEIRSRSRALATRLKGMLDLYGPVLHRDGDEVSLREAYEVVGAMRDAHRSLLQEIAYSDRSFPVSLRGAADYRFRLRDCAIKMQTMLREWEDVIRRKLLPEDEERPSYG